MAYHISLKYGIMHHIMDNDQLKPIRHSLAHLLAQAVLEKHPEAKVASGPPTETGFYYDFDLPEGITLSQDDFPALEKRIRELIAQNIDFVKKDISPDEAREIFKDQPYRLAKIEEKAQAGEPLSAYTSGEFVDLCGGPHVGNTKEIDPDSFQLTNIAGAYWKGDENNPMLTRVYGLAFGSKKELDEYLVMQEEARKRDHKKLGKELGLFTTSPLVGQGLPLFTPRGTIIRDELEGYVEELNKTYGYQKVWIPHIAKPDLYKTSGHWDKFEDDLFHVKGKEDAFVMKPMNCPHHTQIYAAEPRSYKDLPLRFHETTTVYRDEQSGELGGLTRVRCITQDDGHTFLRPDQIEEEFDTLLEIQQAVLSSVQLSDFWISLSLRDPNNKEAYLGDDTVWENAQRTMEDILQKKGVRYEAVEGEAAFYGPKMDLMAKDSLGRQWQLSTIQLDFNMPKRFELEYTDKDGSKQTPVMIHRAFMGSTERFMGVLIEHFAGNFPTWLSPVQVKILPISDDHKEYAQKIVDTLKHANIRAELDESNETLGKKVRNAQLEKVPYWMVIGDKEKESGVATLESREGEKKDPKAIEDIATDLKTEIEKRQ